MKGLWVPPDTRDDVIDFVGYWSTKTGMAISIFITWLGISASKYYRWQERYGKVNEHNHWIPRDFWLEDWEKEAMVSYFQEHPNEGYRRLCFMMLDEDVVAVSPSSVYRVLRDAHLLCRWNQKGSRKGTGFQGPTKPHEHWHVDISYLNIGGVFYYLISLLDGYSRYIVHWEIRQSMTADDVTIVVQRARERFPDASPRIISDRGSQFVSRDFREYIRESGMTHVLTSPHYPQSNGKKERWYRTIKSECFRPKRPLTLEEARVVVAEFVDYYNTHRLHSGLGYIAPLVKLEGRAQEIFAARDRKLEAAREQRRKNRQRACQRTAC